MNELTCIVKSSVKNAIVMACAVCLNEWLCLSHCAAYAIILFIHKKCTIIRNINLKCVKCRRIVNHRQFRLSEEGKTRDIRVNDDDHVKINIERGVCEIFHAAVWLTFETLLFIFRTLLTATPTGRGKWLKFKLINLFSSSCDAFGIGWMMQIINDCCVYL